jgi:hypothetical protein
VIGRPALAAMLGMAIGLVIDAQPLGLTALLAVCSRDGTDLVAVLQRHWALMPAMHVGMLVAGLAAMPLARTTGRGPLTHRVLCHLGGLTAMVIGMAQGGMAAGLVWPGHAIAHLAGMLAGMACGMAASDAAARFRARGVLQMTWKWCVPSRANCSTRPYSQSR